MNRRGFIASTLCGTFLGPLAARAETIEYTPALYRELRKSDDVAVYLFWSNWSLTCGFQRDALAAVLTENAEYARRLRFVHVDHDVMGESRMAAALKVPRRSTILVMKGKRELARIEQDTRQEKLRAVLDEALAAAGPKLASNEG